MSVKFLKSNGFFGYRVRREIEGKTHQHYFSLKKNGKRLVGKERELVKKEAELLDQKLSEMQVRLKKESDQTIVDEAGARRKILYRFNKRKDGSKHPVFRVATTSRLFGKVMSTSVSIAIHGRIGAWKKAVDHYCFHKEIDPSDKAYRDLIALCPGPDEVSEKIIKPRLLKRQ